MSKICSNCNTENVDAGKFCRKCGSELLVLKEKGVHYETELEAKQESNLLSKSDKFNISFFMSAFLFAIITILMPLIKNEMMLPIADSLRAVFVLSLIPGVIGIFIPSKTIKKHVLNSFNLFLLIIFVGVSITIAWYIYSI